MTKNHGDDSRSKGGIKMIVSGSSSPFDSLPEDRISNIISFTSPREACVVASVSKTFKSAANSVIVSLIPPSRVFSPKKKPYFSLCDDPVLIDDGKKLLVREIEWEEMYNVISDEPFQSFGEILLAIENGFQVLKLSSKE